ncbi:hypothetical protein V5799_011296 [Amblyomma americanum]|uniref:Gustatory receptor n=1 Tax=Amblyomma americanum TaxID=6943 RepID=A0AAQ4EHI4_AMBAM
MKEGRREGRKEEERKKEGKKEGRKKERKREERKKERKRERKKEGRKERKEERKMDGKLCRLCGCFFIRDLFEGNGRSLPRIVWKSWYTVYSCGCLASLLWIEIDVIVGEGYQANKRFYFLDNTLQVITRTVVLVKVLINLFCLFIGSSRILEFYLRAADFEKRAGISSCACCAPRKYFWSDLRRACLCVVYCSVFVVEQLLAPRADMSHHRGSGRGWIEAYAWTRYLIPCLFYFAYDSVHNMALISSCQVLVEYLRSQLKVLEECIYCFQGNGPPSSRSDTATRVEMVRMRLCDIEELNNAVNDIWKWPLVATSVCILLVLCTAVYDVCKGGLASRDNYGSCFYALYLMYEFLALTFVSQSLANMCTLSSRSPKVVWAHWYTLYAAACFAFFLWFETDVVTRHAIELSDTKRFFTKSLLVLLHAVVIVKASGNFLTMVVNARRILEFLQKAEAFEKDLGVTSCLCCGQRHFFWTDLGAIATFALYFVSYTAALFHQEQKVDPDDSLTVREIVNRVCSFFAAGLFFTYDSVNFVALRHSAEVLECYILFLKHSIDGCVGCKVAGCELEAAKKVQAVRLHLCTVLEMKNDINGIWQRSVVVSSVGLLLVTCISLYTIITEGLRRTELWIAIGYSAFTSYEFLQLARVSQSLSNTMAGSIITYTVILVQTSPEYEAAAAAAASTLLPETTTTPAITI